MGGGHNGRGCNGRGRNGRGPSGSKPKYVLARNKKGHSRSTYALRGREWVREMVYAFCFYHFKLLFKSVQGGWGSENHLI